MLSWSWCHRSQTCCPLKLPCKSKIITSEDFRLRPVSSMFLPTTSMNFGPLMAYQLYQSRPATSLEGAGPRAFRCFCSLFRYVSISAIRSQSRELVHERFLTELRSWILDHKARSQNHHIEIVESEAFSSTAENNALMFEIDQLFGFRTQIWLTLSVDSFRNAWFGLLAAMRTERCIRMLLFSAVVLNRKMMKAVRKMMTKMKRKKMLKRPHKIQE